MTCPRVASVVGVLVAAWCSCITASAQDAPSPAPSYAPLLSSYLQVRRTEPTDGDGEWALRQLKLMVDGGPTEGIHYHVQVIYKTNLHSSTDDRVTLEDAFLVVPLRRVSFKMGQFTPPFGLERLQPDATLLFTERSRVTNQMVPNGNLGTSFARDRGVEADLARGGWDVSGALLQGAGANMPSNGNGPLGVFRIGYARTGTVSTTSWSVRAGGAGSDRHAHDMNLASALPGIDNALTSHFAGDDRRLNAFLLGRVGRWHAQAELFRAWLAPDVGTSWTARGVYGQTSVSIVTGLEAAARYEVYTPDVRTTSSPATRQWNAAVTYALPKAPIRLSVDYTARNGGSQPSWRAWTFQAQWFLFRGVRVWR
jgi:phosphate-selective porin